MALTPIYPWGDKKTEWSISNIPLSTKNRSSLSIYNYGVKGPISLYFFLPFKTPIIESYDRFYDGVTLADLIDFIKRTYNKLYEENAKTTTKINDDPYSIDYGLSNGIHKIYLWHDIEKLVISGLIYDDTYYYPIIQEMK
nr:hypothetical protein [Abalone asfa-like virus]